MQKACRVPKGLDFFHLVKEDGGNTENARRADPRQHPAHVEQGFPDHFVGHPKGHVLRVEHGAAHAARSLSAVKHRTCSVLQLFPLRFHR